MMKYWISKLNYISSITSHYIDKNNELLDVNQNNGCHLGHDIVLIIRLLYSILL